MSWVTCQLAATNQTKSFNTALCKSIENKTTVSVLEFIDGEKVVVKGALDADALNNYQGVSL